MGVVNLIRLPKDRLLHAGTASLLVKLGHVGLGLAVAVVLARSLGADGFGQYAFVYAVITILAVPTQLGLPQFVVRETARAEHAGRPQLIRVVWRWAHLVVIAVAVLMLGASLLIIGFVGSGIATPQAFFWGLILLPMIALANVRGAALRGLGRVVLGQIPEDVLRPLFLLGLLSAALLVAGQGLTAERALMLHVGAAALAFAIGAFLLVRSAPPPDPADPAVPQHRAWLVSAGTLGATAGLLVINANLDLVMLGLLRSEAEVGMYKVATTGAGLVAFGLQAINMVIMPRVSRLYAASDKEGLQLLVTASARLILLAAAVAAVVLLLFGDRVLVLAFGETYRAAYPALAILALGQLINAAFGSVSLLLNMTGHERDTLKGVAVACVANVTLNIVLIPPFGMEGAAVATAITFLIWNAQLWRQVEKRIGINSLAFSMRRS